MSEIEEAVDQIINRRGDWAVALDWLADIAQGKKPGGVAAPDYSYRVAGDVLQNWRPDGPGVPVNTLDALAEAVRRGYVLGYGAAQSL